MSFCGLESKNPFKNVGAFLEICSIIFLALVMPFIWVFLPFSLKDKTKAWLDIKTNIITWDQLQKEF